jgi:hypothetical protein
MGRSHLERGGDSDGDGSEHTILDVLSDVGGSDVAGGESPPARSTQRQTRTLIRSPGLQNLNE